MSRIGYVPDRAPLIAGNGRRGRDVGRTDGHRGRRWAATALMSLLAVTGSGLIAAAPASAHAEVSSKPAVAGAANAVVTIFAEAESGTAGITSVRIVLPAGVRAADVTPVEVPPGWVFSPTPDGYLVAGDALPVLASASHRIRIAQLPKVTALTFKTVTSYSDGHVDRWVEDPAEGSSAAKSPAPVLDLEVAVPAGSADAGSNRAGPSTSVPVVAAVAGLAVVAGGVIVLVLLLVRRRRSADGRPAALDRAATKSASVS